MLPSDLTVEVTIPEVVPEPVANPTIAKVVPEPIAPRTRVRVRARAPVVPEAVSASEPKQTIAEDS